MAVQTFTRRPISIVFQDTGSFKDTYGGSLGLTVLQATHLKPERPSDTVLVTMHPIGGTASLPFVKWLAEAGVHVFACDSRYRGADYALIMEKVAADLGAAVRYAKERLGYARVVLLGWSGGGSLSAFYQSQAENPTITATAAGDACDLTAAKLVPADAIAFVAAHVSRHEILTDALDPSIVDERNPDVRHAAIDIFGGTIPVPYDQAFVDHFRAAQKARNRRITAWVKDKLASLKAGGRENDEFCFVTHGTMADPRWTDPAIDPNDRKPGWCYLGDPSVVNMSPIGFARYSSLRSWLSQWSFDDAPADAPRCLAQTSVPVLVINNSADDACAPSHARRLYDAIPHEDRAFHEVAGATHYFQGQPELASEAIHVIQAWMRDHGLDA